MGETLRESNKLTCQANDDITSSCGRLLPTVSTVCPLLPLSTKRSLPCTVVLYVIVLTRRLSLTSRAPTCRAWSRSDESCDLPMYPILVFSVISYGLIQTRISLDGVKMIEESHSHLDPMSFLDSYKNTIWISSAERIRSSRMDTSFSQRGNWSRCSLLLITVER